MAHAALTPNRQLAATEYAQFATPGCCQALPYGILVDDPAFPDRNDAHQVFDLRSDDIPAVIADLTRSLPARGLVPRKVTGHDDDTLERLLAHAGSEAVHCEWMFLHRHPPRIPVQPAVTVTAVTPGSAAEETLIARAPGLRRSGYHRASDARLGGEILIALWQGEPVGIGGWYAVGGIARTRYLTTLPAFRGRGVASTLLCHLLERPGVQASRGLALFCDDEATIRWYHQMGFIRQGMFWMYRLPAAGEVAVQNQ